MSFRTRYLDVDGFELDVLAGAPKTLSDGRLQGVQIEVMDQQPSVERKDLVTNLLAPYGFELYDSIHHGEHSVATDLRFRRPNL